MANYIARVELHGATEEEDYENLHAEMAKRGFIRKVLGGDGVWYQLPTGTYTVQNTDVAFEVAYKAAAEGAAASGFSSSLIVTDFEQAQWTLYPT